MINTNAMTMTKANTFKEHLQKFDIFYQSDGETYPDQQNDKGNDKDKYIMRTPSKSDSIEPEGQSLCADNKD